MTVNQLFREWLECHQKFQIKLQTYVRYKGLYDTHIRPRIGNYNIEDLTKRNIQEFMNDLKNSISLKTGKPLSRSSINLVLVVLKLMFDYATEFDLLLNNPTTKIKGIPNGVVNKPNALTKLEQITLERYLANLNKALHYELFGIIICLYTGLRIGELLALEWDDIDLLNGIMHINKTTYISLNEDGNWEKFIDTPKSKTSNRDIPLPDWLIDDLKNMKDLNISPKVVSKFDGSDISIKLFRWRYNEILRKLNIPHHNFHSLRHTFATRAIENGMDVKTLSEILGHANPNITLSVYTHSMDEHKRMMMQNMLRIW